MKKHFALLIALFCLLTFASAASSPAWLTGSLEEALAKAKSMSKLLLLDFFQEYG